MKIHVDKSLFFSPGSLQMKKEVEEVEDSLDMTFVIPFSRARLSKNILSWDFSDFSLQYS